jgi:hypothetical protein
MKLPGLFSRRGGFGQKGESRKEEMIKGKDRACMVIKGIMYLQQC